MKKMLVIALAAMLSACAPLLGALTSAAGPPPQLPAQATQVSRQAVDFALHAFDAALYGLDFAMDAGRIVPGSPQARQIAAAGRRVMNFLGAAEAARDLGSSATYEEAFRQANTALTEFRQALGMQPTSLVTAAGGAPPLSWPQRRAILDRLDRPTLI